MKKQIYGFIVIIFILIFLIAFSVGGGTGEEPFKVTARTVWGDTEKKMVYLETAVRLTQGKTMITTDQAEIDLDRKQAVLTGPVRLTDPEVTVESWGLEYDLREENGVFQSGEGGRRPVVLQRRPKADKTPKNDDPFTLTAGELFFETPSRNFWARSQDMYESKLTHQDFTGIAFRIAYTDRDRKLLFEENVHITQGETFVAAARVEIDLEQKKMWVEKKVDCNHPEGTITAGALDYDLDNKAARFKGDVVFDRSGKETATQSKENGGGGKDPFKLTGDELYFETEARNFTAGPDAILEHRDFQCQAGEIRYLDQAQTMKLTEKVRLTQENTKLTGKEGEILLADKMLHLSGQVHSINPEVEGAADNLKYDYREKRGTFTGNVTLKRNETSGKDPFELTSEEVDFDTRTNNFAAKRKSKLKHRDFDGVAEQITYDDEKERLKFKEKVCFVQEDTTLTAAEAEIDLERRVVLFNGKVQTTHPEVTIDAENVTYDLDKKTGIYKNNVVMKRAAARPDSREGAKEPFQLRAEELNLETKTKNFNARKGVLEHKDFQGAGDWITYNDQKQELVLKGNARVTRPGGEEIRGEMIIIDLKNKDFTVRNGGSINIKVEEKKP